MSLIGSDELFRYGVLPLVIGVVSATLSAFIQWSKDRSERKRTNEKTQMEKAVDICGKVVEAADDLTSHMKHDAWYIAWRKARPEDNDHADSDAEKWKAYKESLHTWRKNEITYGRCKQYRPVFKSFALD
jgi:predicted ATP-binding protein involved in virulence